MGGWSAGPIAVWCDGRALASLSLLSGVWHGESSVSSPTLERDLCGVGSDGGWSCI